MYLLNVTLDSILSNAWPLMMAVASSAGIWKAVNSYIERNKTKSLNESAVITGYKELFTITMGNFKGLSDQNLQQQKEMAQMKLDYQNDLHTERMECDKRLDALSTRIAQLESKP